MSGLWRITLDTNPEDCNLSCVMCEEHSEHSDLIRRLYERTGIKRRRMPFTMVREIMEQAVAMGVREVIPSTMGEPLLYRQMDEVFALAAELGLKVNLTTNGTFPRKSVEQWGAIIVPVTSDVKISWNGATKGTAEAVMKGLKYEQALENVGRFVKVRDEHFERTGYYCRLTLQLTFMQNNMHELPDIIRLAAELGVDRVKGHHLWAHFKEIEELGFKSSQQAIERWNGIVEAAKDAQDQFRRHDGSQVLLENIEPLKPHAGHAVPDDHECPFLEKELWVSATGTISPCCAPDEQRRTLGDFGNIQTVGLAEVIAGEPYRELAKSYKSHQLCRTCLMRKPLPIGR